MQQQGELAGKVALVTGGASGIGRATAELFAREGATVLIADRDSAAGELAVAAIIATGARASFIRTDVAVAADCAAAVAAAVSRYGRLDVLFNNAGITRRANVIDTTEQEWDQVMAVNVKSIFLMSKYAVPVMQQQGGGSIINTASGWAWWAARMLFYCASKGAVVIMTKAMAVDHGPQNIRVNCVCPGDTDTPMLRNEAHQLGLEETALVAAGAGAH
jgi:NAD(P)-dependent dehydrogenase (short-subunit alcohol dehydrogenase family)